MFDVIMLLLNRELGSRVNLCLVSVFTDIVKDCRKMRNLPQIFRKKFWNVGPVIYVTFSDDDDDDDDALLW